MADIMSIGLTDPIDPLFYFWLAIWYLIILFHSWNIPEIWDKIKGVETLFLAGVLSYFLTQLTRNIILPLIDFISNKIEWSLINLPFVNLPTVPDSGPGNDITNTVSIGLFMLAFSIFLFTGAIFLIVWVLRFALDPDRIIFKRYRRFREIDKLRINKVIPIYFPMFLMYISVIILILFEDILGSIKNISKLPISFSSIIDIVYYVYGIGSGVIMLIIFYLIIREDSKREDSKIHVIKSAVTGKISQFYKDYAASMQSKNPNNYFNNLIDKYKNIFFLYFGTWSISMFLMTYKYNKISIIDIERFFLIFLFGIISTFLIKKFGKKKY
jgi:hypothetical protein